MEDQAPKVTGYNPAWLSRPSPGFNAFCGSNTANTFTAPEETLVASSRRTIAKRGTEVFVAVGDELRWADLKTLQEDWDETEELGKSKRTSRGRSSRSQTPREKSSHKVLQTSIKEPVRQLIVSPNESLMAIVCTHAVYVAVLPNSALLRSNQTSTIKLRTYSLGPTAHVKTQPQAVSALWHPLGVLGNCLITVTADAIVRLWELQLENRWSFDSPALTIDLKKLADGTSAAEDFSASMVGVNKAFSPDSFEMEVASACFGGSGSAGENGWASMTLWVAMREGDLYALCPLLPSKWQPAGTLISSLTVSSVASFAAAQDDPDLPEDIKRSYRYQMDWMKDIDEQDPTYLESTDGEEVEIYKRPAQPSPIPQLQGPFEFLEKEEDRNDNELLTDIYVIPAKAEPDDQFDDEEDADYPQNQDSISIGVVCLLTNFGQVRVCLDTEGVSARWLPAKKSKKHQLFLDSEPPTLLVFEHVNTLDKSALPAVSDLTWPLFSKDPRSRSSFFVTHSFGAVFVSTSPWLQSLQDELETSEQAGQSFRFEVFARSGPTVCNRVLAFPRDTSDEDPPPASLVFLDSVLGYMLLTSIPDQPMAATFANPISFSPSPVNLRSASTISPSPFLDPSPSTALTVSAPVQTQALRQAYSPNRAFYSSNPLPTFFASHAHARHQTSLRKELRLSPATLDLLTEAHRVLATYTNTIGLAAATLFVKCRYMQGELAKQITSVKDLANKIDTVVEAPPSVAAAQGDDDGRSDSGSETTPPRHRTSHPSSPPPPQSAQSRIEERMAAVRDRQEQLEQRTRELRRKAGKMTRELPLGPKERRWKQEIEAMAAQVMVAPEKSTERKVKMPKKQQQQQIWFRFPEAEHLYTQLVQTAKQIAASNPPPPQSSSTSSADSPSSQQGRRSSVASTTTSSASASRPASASNLPQTPTRKPGSGNGGPMRVPADVRKAQTDQVMGMLERESALVEATKARLERLALV